MFAILLVGGMIFLVADILVALIVLSMQQQSLARALTTIQLEHQAQEEHTLELEEKLTAQSQQLQQAWHTWQAREAQRFEALAHQHEVVLTQLNLEHEVARLPHVEEMPLALSPVSQRQHLCANWRPARLFGANLCERDLSHRYLGGADLREAQLTGTNLYLADLSGASLAGANLAGADLSGANLSDADLRNAILTNANLLVADLHRAVLSGANLLAVRNLSSQQLCSAIFDRTTQLDTAGDFTSPHRCLSSLHKG